MNLVAIFDIIRVLEEGNLVTFPLARPVMWGQSHTLEQ